MPIEDTGDGGQWVWAYTAQLGNGLSATLSAEARRDTQIVGIDGTGGFAAAGTVPQAGAVIGTFGDNAQLGYGGWQAPDVVANLRLDQTWGSAQVMGALHDVNATYYDAATASGNGLGTPGDQWGWVIGAGLRLNFPMIAQGDYFQGEINYTQGGLRYLNQPTQGNYGDLQGDNEASYGIMSDCVYGNTGGGTIATGTATGTSGCQLTTAWSINASYEHYWTPSVHESFVGAYEAVNYNSQANAILCFAEGSSGATPNGGGGAGAAFFAAPGCNNNWSTWGASTRLQWDVTKSFYLGVEVMYNHLNGASSVNGVLPAGITGLAAVPGPAAGTIALGSDSQNAWSATVRMHKDFLP
jgi:hypothetical protein